MTDLFHLPPIYFFLVMGIAITGWGSLVFFPTRHWANFWYAGVIVPLILSAMFIYILLVFAPHSNDAITGWLSLPGIYKMWGNNGLMLATWINVLMIDLVCGAWMTRKAAQTHMPYIYLLPCLIVTFVFAGFGFTLYCVAMAFGERWGAIAALERTKSIPPAVLPAVPAGAGELTT